MTALRPAISVSAPAPPFITTWSAAATPASLIVLPLLPPSTVMTLPITPAKLAAARVSVFVPPFASL